MFKDRKDAGQKLAQALEKFREEKPLILAIPRGGVEVAYEAIKKFGFEWDLIIPRKIGAPQNQEVAIGAVSSDGTYFIDEYYTRVLGISQGYIEAEAARQVAEIKRRMKAYKGSEIFPDVAGRTVIIIDDGIATGFTILAAIESVKNQGAKKIVVATPVAPQDTVSRLSETVDEVICLLIPLEFYAVGMYYDHFNQTTDEEIFEMMTDLGR